MLEISGEQLRDLSSAKCKETLQRNGSTIYNGVAICLLNSHVSESHTGMAEPIDESSLKGIVTMRAISFMYEGGCFHPRQDR